MAFEIKGAIRNVEETAPWDVIALAEAGDGFVKNAAFETALKMRFVEAMERLDAVSLDQLHKINGLVQHADSKTKLVLDMYVNIGMPVSCVAVAFNPTKLVITAQCPSCF